MVVRKVSLKFNSLTQIEPQRTPFYLLTQKRSPIDPNEPSTNLQLTHSRHHQIPNEPYNPKIGPPSMIEIIYICVHSVLERI